MKKYVLLMVTFTMLRFCPLGRAQDQEPTIDSIIAGVRANMQADTTALITKADRTALIATGMNLNDKDSAAFWPIYWLYEYDRSRLNDRRIAVIEEYTQEYPDLSDADAKAMAEQVLECDSRLAALNNNYFKKFNKVLPALTIAKFFQLERRVNLVMDIQLEADARNSLSAVDLPTSENPLKNDQDVQKIKRCRQFLEQMFAGRTSQDDGACH